MVERLQREFERLFGKDREMRTYLAPGRVNLIGEHTDYNGGHVFPCALTIGTYGVVRKRADRKLPLEYSLVPINLRGIRIVIASSNKKRGLGDSKYNERRSQCEQALADLKRYVQIDTLGELMEDDFAVYQVAIDDETNKKRAKHAVHENKRAIKAVEVLKGNNIPYFGMLMNDSHRSLQRDYEVTGKELDTLVEAAWSQPGVIGARMTGAGFGGCTVNLVKEEYVESFIREVGNIYKERIGYEADFYVVDVGDGPCRLS